MTILFIGNSHTYFHGMPYQVGELLAALGVEAQITMVAQPGKSLEWHCGNPATKMALSYGDWDHIILQQATHPFRGGPEFLNGVKGLLELMRGDPSVWFYKTWCPKDSPEDQQEIDAEFSQAAKQFGIPIIPVSDTWHEVERRDPGHDLYDADGKHAGPGGSYVTALCITRALSGKSTHGLPATLRRHDRIINQVPPEDAPLYQNVVDDHIHPRCNEDIDTYNQAAINRLAPLGVEINDLNASVRGDLKKNICDDRVHLTETGANLCAERVASAVIAK